MSNNKNQIAHTLKTKVRERRALNQLCAAAVTQGIRSGRLTSDNRRNYQRLLSKYLRKNLLASNLYEDTKAWLKAAAFVLATLGFAVPSHVAADPYFEYVLLHGRSVGANS